MKNTRQDLRAATVLFTLVLAACGGDAESREDLEGEGFLDAETPAAAERSLSPAPRPGPAAREAPRSETATPEAAPAEAPARAISSGTQLTFEVREDVSTSSHAPGDPFTLVLVDQVRGTGDAVIPAGTSAQGIVQEARESEGPEDEALLAVQVVSIQVNGAARPLPARVETADTRTATRDSGARTGATIATGTAAGAVIGQILGRDTRSTVTGAAVGTVAGAVVALTTRDGHASLPEGSRIVVRLEDDLVF